MIYIIYLSAFYSTNEVNVNRQLFAHQWLSNIQRDKSLFRSFFNDFKDYRDYLTSIVNKIKHEHGTFADIRIGHPLGKVIGYTVLKINNDGALSPDENVHDEYKGMATANSYTYDIPFHVYNIYRIAELASEVIVSILASNHNVQHIYKSIESSREDKLIEVLKNVSRLGNIYFPNEVEKEVSNLSIDDTSLKIDFGKNLKLYNYTRYKAEYIFSSDGYTNSYKLPYM